MTLSIAPFFNVRCKYYNKWGKDFFETLIKIEFNKQLKNNNTLDFKSIFNANDEQNFGAEFIWIGMTECAELCAEF
jgi:hypothetical protein